MTYFIACSFNSYRLAAYRNTAYRLSDDTAYRLSDDTAYEVIFATNSIRRG